jgi:hypothetical protein
LSRENKSPRTSREADEPSGRPAERTTGREYESLRTGQEYESLMTS